MWQLGRRTLAGVRVVVQNIAERTDTRIDAERLEKNCAAEVVDTDYGRAGPVMQTSHQGGTLYQRPLLLGPEAERI